ncbi:M48 family metalloprotease [Magnetofaba australis]|uniref:Putative peptidase M48, Ste24p n=1 Tax=Magnetofaba australis IT-1 TaxID=1434232 RepID=A0A1Y2K3H8_9PROT|nr:M48 family metalloprotease [Magnetofaba australis]OSM03937.1 putative peptidase M48, Ste24p [Magnetofaba australis IT-1]
MLRFPRCTALLTLLMTLGLTLGAASPLAAKPLRLVTDPETLDLIDEIAQPLVAAAGLPKDSVRYYVVLNPTLNAFALADQRIVFHSGLLAMARNRDELAAVIAHELAHLAAGHHIKLKSDLRRASIQSLITMAAGLAAGLASGNSKAVQAGMVGGQAAARSGLLAAMRQKESQADQLAVNYMGGAHYDPHGVSSFMDLLNREQRMSVKPPAYLVTHPLGQERLSAAEDLVAHAPATTVRPDHQSERLLRARAKLMAGTASDPNAMANHFVELLKQGRYTATDPERFAWRYGHALALLYAGRLLEALEEFNGLLKEAPDDLYILRHRGLTYLEMGDAKRARRDLRRALAQRPDHPDLRLRLAQALKADGEPEEAARMLRRLTLEHPDEADPFYVLGVIEGQQGRLGASHLALARYYALLLQRKNARWHYQQALQKLPEKDPARALIKAELKELKEKE